MKNTSLLLSIFAIFLLFSCSEDDALQNGDQNVPEKNTFINSEQATSIAKEFIDAQELMGQKTKSDGVDLKLVYTDVGDAVATKSSNQKPAYYIMNIGDTGYIIVSATQRSLPILGYSTQSSFDPNAIPENMAAILYDFKSEINYAREKGIKVDASLLAARKSFLEKGVATKATRGEVAPILGTIKWAQSPYYNEFCPPNTPVGCVATASAQIMRYWRYPASSTGYHSYNAGSHGTLSFNYDYTLDWDAMPRERLRRANREVAKFCYGVAVALDMNFSPQGSGTYQSYVPRVLQTYYRYPNSIRNLHRSQYSASEWDALIRRELDAGRPVQYAGYGNGGGHSFVCDGYRSNGYFHFNWGWGGMSDGYFLLNALNPGSLGDGGGTGGFNSGQQAIINFQPPGGGNGDGNGNGTNEPTYCEAKGLSTKYFYISSVKMGSMYNSGASNASGYNDYTSKKIYTTTGGSLNYTFTPGYTGREYQVYWTAWIDINNNGSFDSNEYFAKKTGSSAISGKVTLPASVGSGEYRMRVMMKYGDYPSSCEQFNYGEVEDYTVVVR